jgi:hypothetical protein
MTEFNLIPNYSFQPDRYNNINNITIHLYGWSLIYVIAVAIVIFALYLHLMNLAGMLHNLQCKSIFWIVGAGLLSFAVAESSSSYLVQNIWNKMGGIAHTANIPLILLHVIFLCALFWKSRTRIT